MYLGVGYTGDIRILLAIGSRLGSRERLDSSFQQMNMLAESICFFSPFVRGQRCRLLPICRALNSEEYTFGVELAENGFIIGCGSVL